MPERITFTAGHERWPLARPFAIAHGTRTHSDVIVVTASCGGISGRGEGVPYPRYGESIQGVLSALEKAAPPISDQDTAASLGLTGAAASALDAALWDLRCQREGVSVFDLLEWPPPGPLLTAYTISIGSPSEMRQRAKEEASRPMLKVKTGPDHIIPCVAAVREGAPDAKILVDANESWPASDVAALCQAMQDLDVTLIEQPLPAGQEEILGSFKHPVPIFADESFHSSADVDRCAKFFDGVNIKLDKAGGLTRAIEALDAAQNAGLQIMCGCMVGTSLSIAPAFLLAQRADFSDLDAPMLLSQDRAGGFRFDGSQMFPLNQGFWG